MNIKITVFCLLAFCFLPKAQAQCTSGSQWPDFTYTPVCAGAVETIVTNAYAGEYTSVNVTANMQYVFSSSVGTDYMTIVNPNGNVVLAYGQSPLSWNSGNVSGEIRYYLHSNANCGTQIAERSRFIQCAVPVGNCGAPSALAVSNLTSNSVRMTWTAPATAPASYDIYLATTNVAPNANTAPNATTSTAGVSSLSGLTANTTYYYWVRSKCSNLYKSDWVSGGSFATLAALSCNGAVSGLYPDATFTPTCSGSNEVIVNDAFASEYSNVNVLPNKQYTFTSSEGVDQVTITNAAGTVLLASGPTPVNWLSGSTSGVVRYYLHYGTNCGAQSSSLRTKWIKCVDAPTSTCPAPTNLAASYMTSNSVRLTWTAPATAPNGYNVYYSTTNSTPSPDAAGMVVTVQPRVSVLSPLNPATTYYFWVRSTCGSTLGVWVPGGSFTTLPTLTCNSAYYGLYPETAFTPACTGSAEQIANNAYASEFSNINVMDNKTYTFASSISGDYITITNTEGNQVLASGTTPVTWSSGSNSGVIRFYIHTNGCGQQNTNRTKTVTCNTPGSCSPPSNIAVSEITSNSVRLNWTASSSSPNQYDLYFSTTNVAPTANTTPTASVNGVGARYYSPLAANTTYYLWVRANCLPPASAWVSGGSFTTAPYLVCNGAALGIWPTGTYTPACTGNPEIIANDSFAGEFTKVNVNANTSYTFMSSVTTDYITITNATGTTLLASGTTPLAWNSGNTTGTIRFHLHADPNCGTQSTNRVRSMQCGASTVVCDAPTGLAVMNITSDSVKLNWTFPANLPSNYELYYSTANVAPNANTTEYMWIPNSGLMYLSPLQPATTYYWWLRSGCDNYKSTWTSGGSFTTKAALTCNGAIFGLFPPDTFTPANTTALQPVAYQAMASTYSNMMVEANKQYQFSSSITTDFITITNDAGTAVLGSGQSPLTWSSSNYVGMIRYFLHSDPNCGVSDEPRTKYVKLLTLGTDDFLAERAVKLYPNPTADLFTVATGSVTADTIAVYDHLGRLIRTVTPNGVETTLSLATVADGIYYVKIRYQGEELTKKLVLSRN